MILLFGYWPPTDIGIKTRHGMLWKWDKRKVNYKGSGYDVLAMSPKFTAPTGTDLFDPTVPYWGKGTGTLKVDYRATSRDFWKIVKDHRPIAIMSFSRGYYNKSWELEKFGTNWARDDVPATLPPLLPEQYWRLVLNYRNNAGNPDSETWLTPYIGGSATDPSPLKGMGIIDYRPPDRSKAASLTRQSNLPNTEIKAAVNAHFPDPPGNVVADIDETNGAGRFVSNFMAYHVVSYREWWDVANNDPQKKCLLSGHTHVGAHVAATDGQTAVDIQLDELFEKLPKP